MADKKTEEVVETAAKAPVKKTAAKKAPAKKAEEVKEVTAGPALKLHHLRPAPGAKTAKTRVGRGEASKGKTAGRGTKGTKLVTRFHSALRVARCHFTCVCQSFAASRTRSV